MQKSAIFRGYYTGLNLLANSRVFKGFSFPVWRTSLAGNGGTPTHEVGDSEILNDKLNQGMNLSPLYCHRNKSQIWMML